MDKLVVENERLKAEIETLSMAHDNLQRELADIKSMLPKDKHTLIKNIIGLNKRVQELEQWVFETKPYIKSLEQQNKRHREAIEFGIEYLKNSDIRQVQLVVTALKSALEVEE